MHGNQALTTKNAPFGNDDTPNLDLKIVGGRRVQFVIDNPDQNTNAQDKTVLSRTWPSPHAGPHGTPSILHQPDWEAYDNNGLQSQESGSTHRADKIRELNRLESTYTSPVGDRSNSFKHGLPSVKPMQSLPPIATQPAASHTYHDSTALKFTSTNNERISTEPTLKKQVAKDLRSFQYKRLKEMYIELTTYDRLLTGMVEESQFSVVALRHNLPLNLSLLKLLFARFVDLRNPKLVNYEKILQFLSECVLHPTEDSLFPNLVLQPHNRSGTTSLLSLPQQGNDLTKSGKHSSNNGTEKSYKDGSPTRNDEEKLVHLIEAQILPSENINVKQLHTSLRELDRSARGQLPAHVVSAVCVRCQLPLTGSLIVKMLKRSETGEGMVNWQEFLAPLVEVQDRRNNNTSLSKEQTTDLVKSSLTTDQHLRPLPWQIKPLNDIGSTSPKANADHFSPVSTASSGERLQLPDGWDAPAEIDKNGNYISPRNAESWIHKFNKLAYALRTYHPYNSEMIQKKDAERVTKNYNLIYGLGFSEKRIENAVCQSVLPFEDKFSNERVSVDTLLALLEGKKRLLA